MSEQNPADEVGIGEVNVDGLLDSTDDNEQKLSRDRLELAIGTGFSPESLYGSYYLHVEDDLVVERGVLVGMHNGPESGELLYLAAVLPSEGATSPSYQRLVEFKTMLDEHWQFFDSSEAQGQQERRLRGG